MLQMSSWKFWLILGTLQLSALCSTGWSQQPAAPTAPAAGSDAKSYVDFGVANGGKGDLDAAIKAFDQAIAIDPKYAPAYFYRGLAFSSQNRPDDAVTNYSQAIQLDPNYKQAYYQRGSLRGEKGDFENAISDFSQVIKLDPKFAAAYYQSGHVRYFKGDLDNASDQLNQALALDPNFAFCYFIRGLIRHAQSHRMEATADFQKSSGLNFPYAALWVWITEMENGQHGLARKDLSDALNKPEAFKPDDLVTKIGGFLLDRITQDQLLDAAKAGNPGQTNDQLCKAWFYIGVYSHLSGDPKGAQASFKNAVATGSTGSEEFVEATRELAASEQP
jgi:lipoprotein NlpI